MTEREKAREELAKTIYEVCTNPITGMFRDEGPVKILYDAIERYEKALKDNDTDQRTSFNLDNV